MARLLGAVMASALLLLIGWVGAAAAWDRGHVNTFAVLPDYAPGVPESAEGLAVGLDGNIMYRVAASMLMASCLARRRSGCSTLRVISSAP